VIVSGYSEKSAARKLHFQRGPPATRASDADASEFVFLLFLNLYFCFIDDPFRLPFLCIFTNLEVEVCMGMGKTGIPWVPWDSHGNGSKISHGIGMGWEWELRAWEWELRRGSCHQQL